jgi:molecular chaperone DnaK
MRADADAHSEDDKKRREEVEVRNESDNLTYRAEKFVRENGDKLGSGKASIEEATKAAKEALKGNDVDAIRSSSERLNQAMQTASAELYKNAGGPAGAAPGDQPGAQAGGKPPGSKGDGSVIDAEVVDEKKA